MRKKEISKGKMQGSHIELRDGPWAGQLVFIPSNGTLVFKLGEWHGSYGGAGTWIPLK